MAQPAYRQSLARQRVTLRVAPPPLLSLAERKAQLVRRRLAWRVGTAVGAYVLGLVTAAVW